MSRYEMQRIVPDFFFFFFNCFGSVNDLNELSALSYYKAEYFLLFSSFMLLFGIKIGLHFSCVKKKSGYSWLVKCVMEHVKP